MRKSPKNPTPNEWGGDPRLVELLGFQYFIDWGKLRVGQSFFMPTTATKHQVKQVLTPVMEAIPGLELQWHPRVEYGRYGYRVWRTY